MPDDRFRSRPDNVRLFKLLAAGNRHHCQLRREALHMFRLPVQKTLRDQQRKVCVLMPRRLEPVIQFTLHELPHRVAVGLDDHAALHDLRRLRHVPLQNDVLIPCRKILIA